MAWDDFLVILRLQKTMLGRQWRNWKQASCPLEVVAWTDTGEEKSGNRTAPGLIVVTKVRRVPKAQKQRAKVKARMGPSRKSSPSPQALKLPAQYVQLART